MHNVYNLSNKETETIRETKSEGRWEGDYQLSLFYKSILPLKQYVCLNNYLRQTTETQPNYHKRSACNKRQWACLDWDIWKNNNLPHKSQSPFYLSNHLFISHTSHHKKCYSNYFKQIIQINSSKQTQWFLKHTMPLITIRRARISEKPNAFM